MTVYRFTNNASTTLASSIDDQVTAISVAAGEGNKFPLPAQNESFMITVVDVDGNREIMECTQRVLDDLTVVRGQEGTTARSFNAGSRVELRLTAQVMDAMLQKGGGTMDGTLDMAGNQLVNPDMGNSTVPIGTVQTSEIIPPDGDAANAVTLPGDGNRARVSGNPVITLELLLGVIFPYSGPANAIPPWFKLCDGTNGTPDLRDKFIVGEGTNHPAGSTGNGVSTTDPAGAHDHGGVTGDTVLTIDQMPLHGHPLQISAASQSSTESHGSGGVILETSVDATYPAFTGAPTATRGEQLGGSGGGQPHNHAISAEGDHTHTVSAEPPYYTVAFVMLRDDYVY